MKKKNVSPFGERKPGKSKQIDTISGGEYADSGVRRDEMIDKNEITKTNDGLREKVTSSLQNISHIVRSEIKVDVDNGNVFLHGKVRRRRDKDLAQKIVESIDGVSKVNNLLEVNDE